MIDLTRPRPPGMSTPHHEIVTLESVFVFGALLALLDRPITLWVRAVPDNVVFVFDMLTQAGLSDWILIPTLVVTLLALALSFVFRRRLMRLALRQLAAITGFVFLGVGLPGLFANIVKRLIGRARPTQLDQDGVLFFSPLAHSGKYESFPSGHTTTGIAFGLVMSFLIPRGTPVFVAFGLLIGLSRIMVGQHYPTDVLGGLVVGSTGAYLVRAFFARRGWVFRRLADGRIVRRPLVALQRVFRRSGRA